MIEQGYNAMSTPYVDQNSQHGSSIITLTNPKNELEVLRLALKRQSKLPNGGVKQFGNPLMTDEGVSSVVSHVHSLVNQVSIFSHIEDRHIEILMIKFSEDLIKDLMVNWKSYGIEPKKRNAIRDKILGLAQNHSFLCLRRAYKGGDKSFWKNTIQEFKTTVVSDGGDNSLLSKIAAPLNAMKGK